MKKLPLILVITITVIMGCYGNEDYIDPYDMVNFDPVSKTMKKKNQAEEKPVDTPKEKTDIVETENTLDSNSLPNPSTTPATIDPVSTEKPRKEHAAKPEKNTGTVLFRKFVKKFLSFFKEKTPETTQEYHVWIKMSKDQYDTLQRFSNGRSNVHDAQEILTNMITGVTKSEVGTTTKLSMWFEEKTGASLDSILKVVAIMVLISMVLYMEIQLHVSWRRRVTQIMILAFIISIPMTWYELYQTAQINQQTVTMKEAPKECVQDMGEGNWLANTAKALKHMFTLEQDKCQQYYEHMLIDPLLKVTPTKALAVTFVRFFLSPLKDVGTAFSEFMRALLIDLPVTLYPVVIITLSGFLFLFLFMWFGYSIRLPFFLSIEPTPRITANVTTDNTPAIEGMKKQLEALQESIQNSESNMADQLRKFGLAQTSAIEYTVSAMSSNIAPPTLCQAINSRGDFESSSEIDVKSPIPCSDDSFSVVEDSETDLVIQETRTKIVQATTDNTTNIIQETTVIQQPVENIGTGS